MAFKNKLIIIGLLAAVWTSSCAQVTEENAGSSSSNPLLDVEPETKNDTNTTREELPEPESLAWVDPARLSNQGMIVRNVPSFANLLGLGVVEYKKPPGRKQQHTSSSYGRPYNSRLQSPQRHRYPPRQFSNNNDFPNTKGNPSFVTNSHGRPYNYNNNVFNTYTKPNKETYRNRPFLTPSEAFRQQKNIHPSFHSKSIQPKVPPQVKSPPYIPGPPATPPPPLGTGLVNMISGFNPFKPSVIPGDLPLPPRNQKPSPPPNYDPRRPRLENNRPRDPKFEPDTFKDPKPVNSPNLDFSSPFMKVNGPYPETIPYNEELEPHLGDVTYDYEDGSDLPHDGMEYVRDFPMRDDLYVGKDGSIYLKDPTIDYKANNNGHGIRENNWKRINLPNYNTGNNHLNKIERPSSSRNPKYNRDRDNYFNQVQHPPYIAGINNFNSVQKPRRPSFQNTPFRPKQKYPTQNDNENEAEYNESEYHKRLKNHNLDGTNDHNKNLIFDNMGQNNGFSYNKYDQNTNSPFNYRFKNVNNNLQFNKQPNYNYGPHNSKLDPPDNSRYHRRPRIPPPPGTPVRWPKPRPPMTSSNMRPPHQPLPPRQSPDIPPNKPYNPPDKQPNMPYDYHDEYDNNFYSYDPSERINDEILQTYNNIPEEENRGFYPGNGFFDADFPTTFYMPPSYNQDRRILPSGTSNRG